MPTFIDFKKEVVDFFKDKKQRDDLDHFETISPAKLKDLLLSKLASGELQQDIPSLEKIFNNAKKFENLTRAITHESIDKFRPIQYFIQGKTTIPTDDTIILLSIFIDFQPRPYTAWKEYKENHIVPGRKVIDSPPNPPVDNTPPTVTDPPKTGGTGTQTKKPAILGNSWNLKDKKSLSIMAGALVLTVLMAFYSWPHKQCMYWNGESYIAIDCSEVNPQLHVMALDSEKLKHFKKIMRPDTLTKAHVNKVWYSKISNDIDFFTCPGLHPVHQHKSLKAATEHIIETYAMDGNKKGAID